MPTVSKQVVVANKLGLHARPVVLFVQTANGFASTIRVDKKKGEDPMNVDGKSIMEMMTLAAVPGTELEIVADGVDAAAAVEKLSALFESRFGEE
jgi:phosphocarrier protein